MSSTLAAILIIALIFVTVWGTWIYAMNKTLDKMDKHLIMSFDHSYRVGNAPIVELNQGPDKILHFLIDTGADINIIDMGSAIGLTVIPDLNNHYEVKGCENIPIYGHSATIQLALRDEYKFEANFCITQRPNILPDCGKALGYKVDGVLGTPFLRKYGYIIDFNTLEAYTPEVKDYETK